MIVELRKVKRSEAQYIRVLQERGRIKFYASPDGYAAYDTDELEAYRGTSRKGRPLKKRD